MNGAQVLIVDDDPALLEALPETLRLRMDDLRVDTSDSGQAALQRIGETDYDALVVDIKMPGMDGLELLSEIKKICPDTPTILITGHGDHDLAVQAMRLGAQDYVTKPIDREYFVACLKRAIECHKLSREVATKRLELIHHTDELEACVQERTVELREALHREQVTRRELDEANRQLEELNRQRELFVSLVAHDLAAPLTTIRGYAEILGRENATPRHQDRAREVIVSETTRLARLAGDLVDATQIVSGHFRIRPGACDVVELIREQVELARSRAESLTIHLDAPPSLVVVCDRDRLAQVVSNLLTNAIKYAACEEINVHVGREGEEVVLSVHDRGPGIPPEQAERIFQPGSRLGDKAGATPTEGRGFGLHIAKGIVDAHGGRIWVESPADAGARFCVLLPITGVAESAGPGPAQSPRAVTAGGGPSQAS
jgi:two-component system sensor histidine kinase/response regulator